MKKLLFAIAGAAAFAAFAADPNPRPGDIDVLGFEDFNLALETVTGAVVNRNDLGVLGQTQWVSTGEDSSYVTNYVNAPSITEPKPFADATDPNSQYLALDTEGSELQRYFTTETTNGTPTAVAANGTYIDTLVQFTVTEDEEPTIDGTTKLAIWMGVGDGATNLYVKGGYYDESGAVLSVTPQTYKLDKSCVPGTWYRLTVKAYRTIGNAAATEGGTILPAFTILIDGEEVASTAAVYSSAALAFICPSEGGGEGDDYLDAGKLALLKAGKIIPSLDATFAAGTLFSVGFQGTGAIDDFVVTTNNPFEVPAIDFTLTLTGDANTTLGAVTYTVGEGEPQSVTLENDAASIVSNATVTIAAPTFAEDYQLAALTVDGTPVVSPKFPYSFTITADTTIAITAEQIPAAEDWVENPATDITTGQTAAQAYPGLASSALASADAQKLTVWAKANSIAYTDIKNDTTGTYVEAYLLNCAVADVADEKEEFVANITIGANGTPVVTPPANKSYNGTLKLKAKVNLGDLTWTDVEAASTTYKFYMYELSL